MAAFQKNVQPTNSGDKKKVLIMIGLGVVLLVLVLNYLHKNAGARPAAAAEITANGETSASPTSDAIPTETAAQAKAALENDPTAALLRSDNYRQKVPLDVPPDPFAMPGEWRASLVRPDATPVASHVARTVQHSAAIPVLDPTTFKVSGIFRHDGHLTAIINGSLVVTGMTVDNAKIVKISETSIVLQCTDTPLSPPITIVLDQPKLH